MLNQHIPGLSLLFIVLIGCSSTPPAPTSNLRQVDIGMPEAGVLEAMGEPRSVRGSIRNRFDQIIEVLGVPACPADRRQQRRNRG